MASLRERPFSAPCGNGHEGIVGGCGYCDDREEIAADLLILDAMCSDHPGRCDLDCGACGARQEAAARWLLARVEATTKALGL